MTNSQRFLFTFASALICTAASATSMNGKLPMYPNGHNMNSDMPASAIAMGMPLVLETGDSVATVDHWYSANAKSCKRSSASGGFKYACVGGSIMIYEHVGKTQIAFVPGMASMFGGH